MTVDAIDPRIDPAHDRRRLVLFFGGLVAFYLAALALGRPDWGGGEDELRKVAFGVMLAPTVGAVLAARFGPGVIRLGKLTWWVLAAYVPTLMVLALTCVAVTLADVEVRSGKLALVLAMLVPGSIASAVSAVGEEVGWRGFLWPLLRRRMAFLTASAVMLAIWWAYHAPLVFAGLYGSVGGLPAFTVAITGFVLFVGVLTERSRSVWPSVLAHGSWNALVATAFAWNGREDDAMFTGSDALLGEFGWIAAVGMLGVGVAAAWWHRRTPTSDGLSPREAMGCEGAVQSLTIRTEPKTTSAA